MLRTKEKFAVIFDMDGLLVESEHLQSKSYETVLTRYGITPQYSEVGIIQIAGIPSKMNAELLKKKHDIPLSSDELIEHKNKAYRALIEEGVEPQPGAHELVDSLKKAGVRIGVASSSIQGDIHSVLKQIELFDKFDTIVSCDEVENPKPSPDVFLETARRLGTTSTACLVLEDSESGVRAGKAADMTVVAVPSQFTSHNDFSSADKIVNSLEELSVVNLRNLVFPAS